MDKLKNTFQECIGIPIPAEFLPDIELQPCFDIKAEDALLFGSKAACEKPFLVQGQIWEFIQSAPVGYYLIGFWGHGVNSYAFYYSRVDAWSRVFFRLPYGGVYTDNDKMAQQIRAFLPAFLAFEKEIGQEGSHLVAVDSMDYGYYELHSPLGGKYSSRKSMWRNPEFGKLTAWLESWTNFTGEAIKKPTPKGGQMFAEALRNDLSQRAAMYARKNNLGVKTSKSGVVIFQPDVTERTHGNFVASSYKSILNRADWSERLSKPHAAAAKAFSKAEGIRELDSCMSSDALLMNIFCHPRASQWKSLKTLFGVAAIEPEFGHKAKVMKNGRGDRSEIDMKLEGLLVESKLTEADFQQKATGVMETYDRFEQVFHKEMLPKSGKGYFNYQLIRNILAAVEHKWRFCLICDGRRPDLVREFYLTARCVKDKELREKLNIVFWQEIAQAVGEELKVFLREKYGLVA